MVDSNVSPMGCAAATAQVAITVRRLGTPGRNESTVKVDSQRSEADRRALLVELVGARFPQAELRSYADDVASFLGPKLLVVAAYSDSEDGAGASVVPPIAADRQQNLFAA